MRQLLLPFILAIPLLAPATVLHVGPAYPYSGLEEAAGDALPGDTIMIHSASWSGGIYISELQGEESHPITIMSAPGETVIFQGGTNAWQFSDAAWLIIDGFIFQGQTGNGLNFDDGGSFETPAHHIIFTNCTFRDMNASGNNDLLKLSGLDDFEISHCTFLNGASGGSGIDMVGCHNGVIHYNSFENMGSNAIQAKGGTRNIRIEGNIFRNAGSRAVNLGGSTGLAFFRPQDATYEAAELKVYSNIFIGSEAPVAFVGCILSEVVNNTIYLPGKWVLRILQETVDPDRFALCGENVFMNNIVYMNENVNVVCNIGPNTAPETFTFSNNLWHHTAQGSNWTPSLPVVEENQISNIDPLFSDPSQENFSVDPLSPAVGNGLAAAEPTRDYLGALFSSPRSIGAIEGSLSTLLRPIFGSAAMKATPNPVVDRVRLDWDEDFGEIFNIQLLSLEGRIFKNLRVVQTGTSAVELQIPHEMEGINWIEVVCEKGRVLGKVVKL